MKKRGFVEIQANWAFAIIIGMMFLLFFAGVVRKQIDRSAYEESLRTATFMTKIITGGEAYSEITLPKAQNIGVDCDGEKLVVGSASSPWSAGMVAFGPRSMKASKFILARFDEKMPFLYARAAVIIPEDMKIILAYGEPANNTANAVMNAFGPMVSAAKLEDFGVNASLLAIVLDAYDQPERAVALGEKMVFLEANGGAMRAVGEKPYADDSLLIAAIASGFDSYSCGAEKLMKKTGVVAESYRKKAEKLQSDDCSYPINELEMIKGNASTAHFSNLSTAAKTLEIQNSLLAEKSCEVLY